jgi:hypothetical protein
VVVQKVFWRVPKELKDLLVLEVSKVQQVPKVLKEPREHKVVKDSKGHKVP